MAHHRHSSDFGGGQGLPGFLSIAPSHTEKRLRPQGSMSLGIQSLEGEDDDDDEDDVEEDEDETEMPGNPHTYRRGQIPNSYSPQAHHHHQQQQQHHQHQHHQQQQQQQHQQQQHQQQQQQQQQHHHHRLPDQGPPSKIRRSQAGLGDSALGPPSVVGQEGMPPPAPHPRGPKLKFTQEDDQLLVDLKENRSLTWKQIAEFFPGRSSGTLQVRYCTKLKAKTAQWTEETVRPLSTHAIISFRPA
ncbi:MAG: hypothetical protein M4579_002963 [Chaenotheca gracillima]|nr:MAG: hypothetical protein M4579_002963 [Chaenotheca gracillima]